MSLPQKKRRHDGSYSSKYRSTQKDRNWNSENFRENRQGDQERNNPRSKEDMIEIRLIGRKCTNPMIHVCEICSLPILSYGRMIPCKHVFCFSCAKKTDNNCPRCKESMQRIEQCPLGSVWLCALTPSCRRTYLSQRDLQAHINHRHKPPVVPVMPPPPIVMPPVSGLGPPPINVPPPPLIQPAPGNDPFMMVQTQVPPVSNPLSVPARAPPTSNPLPTPPRIPAPVSNPLPTPGRGPPPASLPAPVDSAPRPSSNLITIQIQDSSQAFPPPPPPGRPPNQPQLYPPQSQSHRYH